MIHGLTPLRLRRIPRFSSSHHALVADGLFVREATPAPSASPEVTFRLLPDGPIKPLEELFRAKVIRFLENLNLLPPERAHSLRSWVHSGFNVHAADRVEPDAKAEVAELAQYILRNPFSVEKMTMESPSDNVIYRSRMNVKINRNFEVFSPTDFLAAITQHIPDKGIQMVRYYGWYSNKMRGRRQSVHSTDAASKSLRPNIIPPPPRRLPSKKWRDIIMQVWHTDPLRCPVCQNIMRIIAIIDDRRVVEKILRHLGHWTEPQPLPQARPPPGASGSWAYEPCQDVDPMPDYENVLTD
jgi:hypothetical protein